MTNEKERFKEYDLARTIAIFGMVLINFRVILNAKNEGPMWLMWIMDFIFGRAAVIFVILAGAGLSLMTRRALLSDKHMKLKQICINLMKRSLFLFIAGVMFSQIWGADILRYYGVYLLIGTCFLLASDRWLIGLGLVTAFCSVDIFLPAQYYDFINQAFQQRNSVSYIINTFDEIFVTGFYPIFPWLSFVFLGMWLGRQELGNVALWRNTLLVSLLLFSFLEVGANQLNSFLDKVGYESDETAFYTFLNAEAMPATTLFVFSAGAMALMIISLCTFIKPHFFESKLMRALTATGQLSLTIYIIHILIGYSVLRIWESTASVYTDPSLLAFGSGILFCLLFTLVAYAWLKHFHKGPLEGIMRTLTRSKIEGSKFSFGDFQDNVI